MEKRRESSGDVLVAGGVAVKPSRTEMEDGSLFLSQPCPGAHSTVDGAKKRLRGARLASCVCVCGGAGSETGR